MTGDEIARAARTVRAAYALLRKHSPAELHDLIKRLEVSHENALELLATPFGPVAGCASDVEDALAEAAIALTAPAPQSRRALRVIEGGRNLEDDLEGCSA